MLRTLTIVLSMVAILSCIAWWMDRLSLNVEWKSYFFSYGFFVAVIPLAVALLILAALTNRLMVSFFLLLGTMAGLFAANGLKVKLLLSPIVLTDYFFIRGIDRSTLSLLANYGNPKREIIALVLIFVAFALLWRYERPFLSGWYRRFGLLASSCLLGWLLIVSNVIGGSIYNAFSLRISPYSSLLTQYRAGLLCSLIYAGHEMANATNESVDIDAVAKLVQQNSGAVDTPEQRSAQKPDVVVIQSESFFNPDILSEIGDTASLLPNLHRAMHEGASGKMTVPTFGGGTLRTEFEVLTGIPLASYPKVLFPYLQISQERIPGMVASFNADGYQTIAVHGNSGDFWNRRSAYKSIGFERFITARDFMPTAYRDGWYLSDHSMTEEIIRQLSRGEEAKFIFAVSIEAHGPFRESPTVYKNLRAVIEAPPGLVGDAKEEYLNYAYHISDADREFGRLLDYLRTRHRPFVLVFYGDHLPGFEYVYGAATFDNGLPADQQQVPWVAVGSSISPSEKNLYAWMLPGEVLRIAGVPGSRYLAVSDRVGQQMIGTSDSADHERLTQALYSAARLDLEGKFDDVPKRGGE
jgi:phosphoglycerol transferase MdoB-like AlkP superfamily enzyme